MHHIVARSTAPLATVREAVAAASGRLGTASVAALAALATVATALPAAADDLDVYRARFAARQTPNILFVLDFSGSMNGDLEGNYGDDRTGPAKIDILRSAMDTLLRDNAGQLNAGLGPIFGGTPSGVLWPISPLDADPSTVDPDIPPTPDPDDPDGYSMADVMLGQMEQRQASGDTRTVDALVEAAQYFRGGAVRNGGMDPKRPSRHRPNRWIEGLTAGTGGYGGGGARAAIAASYAPEQGYWQDRFEAGNYEICTVGLANGGVEDCAGKPVVPGSCTDVPESRYRDEVGVEREVTAHERCRYERLDDWDAPLYAPPEPLACQANAIVLISDGQPINTSNDDTALEAIIGTDRTGCEDLSTTIFDDPNLGDAERTSGTCGPELVAALAGTPLVAGAPDSAVKTYTVGFDVEGPGRTYLQRLAADGGGGFFAADRPEQLGAVLQAIVNRINVGAQSFAELSVGVDRETFSSDDRAYMSLFEPSRGRSWSGNLKGYFLDSQGLKGIDGEPATDADGAFLGSAHSFWSAAPDGAEVNSGGASGKLVGAARSLYTDAGDGSDFGASLALSADALIGSGNTAITTADLGLEPEETDERTAALDWLRTAPMGDPLHSKSVGVDYGDRQVVYVMTNQGLLHAIDATAPVAPGDGTPGSVDTGGGEELFAYMPRRLLANLPDLASNEPGGEHVYGLDGAITRWHEDTDADGVVDAGESLLLVLGMRRGGSAYHAIDVSDPTSPSLEWVIDDTTPGFGRLAQSWSRAALLSVRRGTGTERVLAFGGGYDADALDGRSEEQVALSGRRADADGDAVFMVDRDGTLVRRFDDDMDYSIAADLTAMDSDSDGLADRIYAADVGGQVWRIDFDDPWADGGTVTRFADLHRNSAPQPLFSAPSVALIRGAGEPFLAVSVGSGDRTDPLGEGTANALFMMRDRDVAKGAPSASRIDVDDLFDATDDALGSTVEAEAATARAEFEDSGVRGWRLNLEPGEKSLSRLVSFEGALLATTYRPEEKPYADPCEFAEERRFWTLDIATARAANLDSGGPAEPGESRTRSIEGKGIPSSPVPAFPRDSSRASIIVGGKVEETSERRLQRVYWHAR